MRSCAWHVLHLSRKLIADRPLKLRAEDASDVLIRHIVHSRNTNLTNHLFPSSFATSSPVAIHFYAYLPLHLLSALCLNKDWVDHGALALIPSPLPTLFPPTLKARLRARTPCLPHRAAFQLTRGIVFRILMIESYRTRASSSEGT